MKNFVKSLIVPSSLCFGITSIPLHAGQQIPRGYNTPIPKDVLTPNQVQTRLGTFNYFDGFPDERTIETARRQVDLGRGVRAFLDFMPAASLEMMYETHRDRYGLKPNKGVGIFEDLMSSNSLWLTGNTDTVYASAFLDLTNGPVVVEVPAGMGPGTVNDAYFRFVIDMGSPGPDKGRGGKYLIIGPNHQLPENTDGYFVAQSPSQINWLILRGFLDQKGETKTAVNSFKEGLKIYPLKLKANAPTMQFRNLTDVSGNTIHANNFQFFYELDNVIQREPSSLFSPELLGILSSIGIQKGRPFLPDARMKSILTESVEIGNATARAILFEPRDPKAFVYKNKQGYWQNGFPGGSYQYLRNNGQGGRDMDGRTLFFYLATVNTPAMQLAIPGVGSQYAFSSRDDQGRYLDGSQQYKLRIPANAPAKDFWSFVVYDPQTRSMLQMKDMPYPSKNNKRNKDMVVNSDGSVDLFFGPQPPSGQKANWVQTVPGKGWFGIFRLYGPLKPWFDQTWVLPGIQKQS